MAHVLFRPARARARIFGASLGASIVLVFAACDGSSDSTGGPLGADPGTGPGMGPDAGCIPTTCAAQGKTCGTILDGCGGTLSCGTCSGSESCGGGGSPNTCGAGKCQPTTCAAQGKTCGQTSDGCSAVLDCGSCTAPQTCGGGGTPNACGPTTSGGPTVPSPIPADRSTTWNPGILSDGLLNQPLGPDGLPQRSTVCATVSPGGNIQAAIDACPSGQVVKLAVGSFSVSDTINLKSGVVLRGSGSQGGSAGTTVVKTGGGPVLSIGTDRDSTCYGGTAYPLTADAPKESTKVTVGAAASHFTAGDLALIDLADDATVQQGDCPYFKREDGRSIGQRVEIAAVDTTQGTLTLSSPLHWTFKTASPYAAQITKVDQPTTKWAGIESLRIKGGSNTGYNGQMAGGIDISNAAYSWVKDVQTDATIGGMHVSLTGTYRVVVRDSNLHHSANYDFGADCYGIVLRCGAAENLVENNITRYMNKPILFNASGGGNVVGYNYADNAWATPAAWQEVNIDTHCAFPHMELMEGNYAPHMGATNTHGNAGYLTYYRNFASSQFAPPAVVGSNDAQTGNVTALQFDGGDVGMTVFGNVLGTAGVSQKVDAYDSDSPSIYQLGVAGNGASDVATTSLLRHGNFDYVTNATSWSSSIADHALPPSLYLKAKPAWWPAGSAWPWVGPDLSPMVGVLPAKDRSDHLP